MTRIERLMAEVLLLQERGRSCEELSRGLEVSRRTVIRDVQALCEMGVPVISRDGVGGGYSLSPHFSVQPLELSWQEALLLVMALDGLSKMSDSPFSAERKSLAAKLRPLIPDKHLARLDELRENIVLEVPERTTKAPMLDVLVPVVGTRNWVSLDYDSSDGLTKRIIRPDRLYADRGLWYLVGYDGQSSRTMRVDRIRAVGAAEAPASIEEAVPYDDPSHPLIRVELTRRGARMVQRDPHMGEHVDANSERQCLEFRCPPSELKWYASYFGGMGSDALVHAPENLRALIRDHALALLVMYRQ